MEGEAEAVLLKPANLQAFSLTRTVTLSANANPSPSYNLSSSLTGGSGGLPTGMHDSAAEGNAQSVTACGWMRAAAWTRAAQSATVQRC